MKLHRRSQERSREPIVRRDSYIDVIEIDVINQDDKCKRAGLKYRTWEVYDESRSNDSADVRPIQVKPMSLVYSLSKKATVKDLLPRKAQCIGPRRSRREMAVRSIWQIAKQGERQRRYRREGESATSGIWPECCNG